MGVAIALLPAELKNKKSPADSFLYGGERIVFQRFPRDPQSKRIKIKVFPSCQVHVMAPTDASNDEINKAVKRRSRWVYEKLRDFKAQLAHVTPRKYISGESHFYLGRQYVLRINVKPRVTPQVKLLRGSIEVLIGTKNPKKVKQLLHDWYKAKAKEVFHKQLDALLDKALWIDYSPSIRVLSMRTQWGSCSPNGLITLNPHLVKATKDCIDYVILHELCHIAEHNHSQRFYRLLKQVMPNWEKVKERLDSKAAVLLNGE